MTDYTNGNWHAMTLGEFVSLLIDAGPNDVATIMRVVEDSPVNEGNQFIRTIEVDIIPNGLVKNQIFLRRPESMHKVLVALIEAGQVE